MKITFTLLCRIEFRSLLFFIPKWKLWNHYFLKPIVLSPDSLHFLQRERKENVAYCYELYPSTNLLFSVLLSFLSAVSHAMFLFCTLHWVVPYSQKNPTSNCPLIWFGAILICLLLYSSKKNRKWHSLSRDYHVKLPNADLLMKEMNEQQAVKAISIDSLFSYLL